MSILTDQQKQIPGIPGDEKSQDNPALEEQIMKEVGFWDGKTEIDPEAFPKLKEYWEFVNFGDNWSPSGTPWSAVFVSYALRGQGFPKSASHYKYIEEIIASPVSPWKAYDLEKSQRVILNVGDVLIKPRSGDYYSTHGDIVGKIESGKAFLVGGNISNTAKVTKIIDVDSNGRALVSLSPYKIILKKKGRPATLLLFPVLGIVGLLAFLQSRKKNV